MPSSARGGGVALAGSYAGGKEKGCVAAHPGSTVHMRMFANWEMDRASTLAVQRVFTVSVTSVFLSALPAPPAHSIVLTAKLQGHKRSLRSNDIPLVSHQNAPLDMDVDVQFTIQYPHFLKRKSNVLQLLIQRRRKYKNRPIPGGFKTLAIGSIDLTQVLQQGGSIREVALWTGDDFTKENATPIGRLSLSSCQSSPIDEEGTDGRERKDKAMDGLLSSDTESEEEDDGVDSDTQMRRTGGGGQGGQGLHDSRMRKMAHRKNLRQKFASLLRKFKANEEQALVHSARNSVARTPTAKELEALFDELDDLSDSGNEGGVAADELSIGSNPRPALRPFFSTSREILPAIYDGGPAGAGSESEEEAGWSSETDGVGGATTTGAGASGSDEAEGHRADRMPHSTTATSISRVAGVPRNNTVDQLWQQQQPSSSASCTAPLEPALPVWLVWAGEAPIAGGEKGSSLRVIPCSSLHHVRSAIQCIVGGIANFCNSNSAAPAVTWVGLAGGDRLVGCVLRAFVDIALQHKSSTSWLQYLRFAVLPPQGSLIGRLVLGLDPLLDQLSRDVWERWAELTAQEQRSVFDRMDSWLACGGVCVQLPIGEAMLQTGVGREGKGAAGGAGAAAAGAEVDKAAVGCESAKLFVPFLSEVRVGQGEEEECAGVNSPREKGAGVAEKEEERPPATSQVGGASMGGASQQGGGSPPASPHCKHGEGSKDMHVEYWTNQQGDSSVLAPMSTTPNSKKDNANNAKGSIKTSFRTLMITRWPHSPLLQLAFVKEKKEKGKEKMMMKLGMKGRQKPSDADHPPVLVSAVSRLLCSATRKEGGLTVHVDGSSYSDVRFFQTSSQWQTHVKHFPISLISDTV